MHNDDMGEGMYQYLQAMCASAGEKPKPTRTEWVTREGKSIHVKMMTDSHIVNTIRYLRKWAAMARPQLAMQADHYASNTGGEMAAIAASEEATRLYDMDDDDFIEMEIPTWEKLLAEAEKRGLAIG